MTPAPDSTQADSAEATPAIKLASPVLTYASYFGIGLIFAVGLGISGMTRPEKVVNFLDITGNWDPSLMCVMGGAILVHLAMYKWILKRDSPLMGVDFQIPTNRKITGRLLGGAALFGLGWGLSGFCPGPGVVGAGGLGSSAIVFVLAMTVGMQSLHTLETAAQAEP